jgi:hypothetical protein
MAAAKEKKMSRTERNEEDRTNVGKERELVTTNVFSSSRCNYV